MTSAGDILGILGGGRGQVDAAALSAKAAGAIGKVKTDLLSKLNGVGKNLGPSLGGDYFEAIAAGAKESAAQARATREMQLFGISTDSVKTWGLVVGGLAGLWLLSRINK